MPLHAVLLPGRARDVCVISLQLSFNSLRLLARLVWCRTRFSIHLACALFAAFVFCAALISFVCHSPCSTRQFCSLLLIWPSARDNKGIQKRTCRLSGAYIFQFRVVFGHCVRGPSLWTPRKVFAAARSLVLAVALCLGLLGRQRELGLIKSASCCSTVCRTDYLKSFFSIARPSLLLHFTRSQSATSSGCVSSSSSRSDDNFHYIPSRFNECTAI